jgi:two-component system cell cycle sensor histidine kinase/response regulator CckA
VEDKHKTREELLSELISLRRRLSSEGRESSGAESRGKGPHIHEAYFEGLFENAPEAISLVDNQSRVLRINSEFTNIFGYTNDELLGECIDTIIAPDHLQQEAADITKVVATGARVDVESERRRKDGTLIHVSIRGAPIKIGGKQVAVFGIYRDITNQKKLEARILHTQKMEAIGTLAGGISHDFNNLLQVIQGYTDILLNDKKPEDSDYNDLLAIRDATARAAELTSQLLTFSRKKKSILRPIDLNHLINQVNKILQRTFLKSIGIKLELADNLKTINGDPSQLEQVLINLALNAKDAMPGGGDLVIRTGITTLTEEFCLTHPGSTPGRYALLTVSDNGEGMAEETLKHIFEPFYTTKEIGKGTGLGMALVYGIIKEHKGYIMPSSKPGEGTTFEIYLPILSG